MTDAQKLTTLKVLLEDGSGYMPTDETLNTYLTMAANEILSWRYQLVGGIPSGVIDVPLDYENVQIFAVLQGWTHAGAEGELHHHENGVIRAFQYTDMIDYIHKNVLQIARVGAVT